MQSRPARNDNRHELSCEILQEIYGLGPYYLLREDEEKLFQRLVAKYEDNKGKSDEADKGSFELTVRKAILRCKAELATGGFYSPVRKDSVISGRAPRGTSDKDGVDSRQAPRRMYLG
jgi:hypothetical protein